jgi:glycosyltransferase involved in cell wall biosynthesis
MDRRPLLVSIVTPVYNAGRYLDASVSSALAQTLDDFELILVDDGSTDGAVDRLAHHDPRLRILRQPNRGAAAASNAALAVARGRYIALLDQDDLWDPRLLEAHYHFLEESPELDFCFTWSHYIDAEGEPIPLPARRWSGNVSFELLVRDFVVGNTSSLAFRKSAVDRVGPLDPQLRFIYDLDLVLRVALLRRDNGAAIERDLCAYRRHSLQMSRQRVLYLEEWQAMLAKLEAQAPDLVTPLRREATANMMRYFAILAYESGDLSAGAKLLATAVFANPLRSALDARNWKVAAAILAAALLPPDALAALQGWYGRFRE